MRPKPHLTFKTAQLNSTQRYEIYLGINLLLACDTYRPKRKLAQNERNRLEQPVVADSCSGRSRRKKVKASELIAILFAQWEEDLAGLEVCGASPMGRAHHESNRLLGGLVSLLCCARIWLTDYKKQHSFLSSLVKYRGSRFTATISPIEPFDWESKRS